MRSTFTGIEISKRSLFTQQAALQTSGHNIANANTAGYSRQVVNMVASKPLEAMGMSRSTVPGQMGQGVEFKSIDRIREKFLDNQYHNENKNVGEWTIKQDTLQKLEGIFNEPSDSGIRTVVDKFYQAWSDLSKDPENVTGRKIVRETALAMTDAFNQISRQLSDFSEDITQNIDVKATQVNTILRSMASLNGEIRKTEAFGDNANDLRDQRDLLADQLSKIVNISVREAPEGYVVSMGDTVLVQGDQISEQTSASLASAFLSGTLSSGEVYGMFVSRDEFITDYQKQLDTLAYTLANGEFEITIPAGSVLPGSTTPLATETKMTVQGINGLHKLGYTLGSPLASGVDFFTFKNGATGITAASIELNPAIADDTSMIATSMRTVNEAGVQVPVKGNNTLALLMSELKQVPFTFDQTATGNGITKATIPSYYNALIGGLGVKSQEAARMQQNSTILAEQVNSNRASVSGVSLDEEMSNLIKFQHAYNAAAKFMTTIDQVLEKLINGTGVVGR